MVLKFTPLSEVVQRMEVALAVTEDDRVTISKGDLETLLRRVDVRKATPFKDGVVVIDEVRADRIVDAMMKILPYDSGDHIYDMGFRVTAPDETIRALMQSDSTFAGFVISCLAPDNATGKAYYDEWLERSVKKSMDDLDRD